MSAEWYYFLFHKELFLVLIKKCEFTGDVNRIISISFSGYFKHVSIDSDWQSADMAAWLQRHRVIAWSLSASNKDPRMSCKLYFSLIWLSPPVKNSLVKIWKPWSQDNICCVSTFCLSASFTLSLQTEPHRSGKLDMTISTSLCSTSHTSLLGSGPTTAC